MSPSPGAPRPRRAHLVLAARTSSSPRALRPCCAHLVLAACTSSLPRAPCPCRSRLVLATRTSSSPRAPHPRRSHLILAVPTLSLPFPPCPCRSDSTLTMRTLPWLVGRAATLSSPRAFPRGPLPTCGCSCRRSVSRAAPPHPSHPHRVRVASVRATSCARRP